MPATARDPQSAKPLDTATVVAVAGELVDELGPEEVTLTGIARELGVTQPALYRHIEDLADLWRALGLSTRALLADSLAEAAVGLTGPEAIYAVGDAWRAFAQRHPGRYRSTSRYAVAGDKALETATNRTIGVLEQALQGFELSDDERRFAAETLRSALHGFASFELGDGNPDPERTDASFRRMLDHLCAAFSA